MYINFREFQVERPRCGIRCGTVPRASHRSLGSGPKISYVGRHQSRFGAVLGFAAAARLADRAACSGEVPALTMGV
jgi:hypothetical protein